MRPGEASLAHGGVLYLDELGEFPTGVLQTLRQPIEEGCVRIARVDGTYFFHRVSSCLQQAILARAVIWEMGR